KKFDRAGHSHRETPFPVVCFAVGPHGATARPDIHRRERRRPENQPRTLRRPPVGGRTSKPRKRLTQVAALERGLLGLLLFSREPIEPPIAAASARQDGGKRRQHTFQLARKPP